MAEESDFTTLTKPMRMTSRSKNSKPTTGHLNLFGILDFVARHPNIPLGRGFKDYTNLVNSLTKGIPNDAPGWYLWGKFNDLGWWETVYLGKAGNRKTSSLQRRIRDELIKECAVFWALVFGGERAIKEVSRIYGEKYDNQTRRKLRKAGAHFIIWQSMPLATEKVVINEEKILIDIFRPTSNIQRYQTGGKSKLTEKIVAAINGEIQTIKTEVDKNYAIPPTHSKTY